MKNKKETTVASKQLPFSGKTIEIKGNWGRGKGTWGKLFCFSQEISPFDFRDEHRDQILAIVGKIKRMLWYKAKSLGVKGIICGGLPDKEFAQDVLNEVLLIDDQEKDIGLTLVVLGDKKGEISEDYWRLLQTNQGKTIYIEGDKKRVLIPTQEENAGNHENQTNSQTN